MGHFNSYVKLPEGKPNNRYPLVNKQLDPENQHVLMETSLNQPRQLPGSMLIYQRVPSIYPDCGLIVG